MANFHEARIQQMHAYAATWAMYARNRHIALLLGEHHPDKVRDQLRNAVHIANVSSDYAACDERKHGSVFPGVRP